MFHWHVATTISLRMLSNCKGREVSVRRMVRIEICGSKLLNKSCMWLSLIAA